MIEGLDQNKNTQTSEQASRLKNYKDNFELQLDYFSPYIKTLPDKIDSIGRLEWINRILFLQKEFIDFCKEDHPEEYETLKNAMLKNKKAIKKRFKNIDESFFNFE